jgi:hypothetical protein
MDRIQRKIKTTFKVDATKAQSLINCQHNIIKKIEEIKTSILEEMNKHKLTNYQPI